MLVSLTCDLVAVGFICNGEWVPERERVWMSAAAYPRRSLFPTSMLKGFANFAGQYLRGEVDLPLNS